MASWEGVNKLLESEAAKQPAKSDSIIPQPIREIGTGFVRGLYRSPAAVREMMPPAVANRQNFYTAADGRIMRNQPGLPTFDETLAQASGIPAPETFPGRVSERLGITAPLATAAGIPSLAAASPLMAVRNMVIGDVLAAMGEQGAQDAGAGPGLQILAGVAGGMVAPGSVTDDVGRVGKAKAVAADVADAATERAEAEAKRLNVKMGAMRRASGEAKRRMASDPYGGEQFVTEGIDKLRRARELFPDPKSRPTTAQILSDEPGVVGMDAALAKVDDEFRQSLAGRRRVVRNDLMAEWERILPEGSPGGVNARAKAVFDAKKQAEVAAWEAIPRDKLPLIETQRLKQIVAKLRRGPKAGLKYIPNEASVIESFSVQEPVTEIQALISELLDTQRAASRFGASTDDMRRAKRVKPLIDALMKEIDDIPDAAGGAEYRAARNATRELYQLFNQDSWAVDAVLNLGTSTKIARAIRSADNPAEEARKAVRILDQTPGGRDNLARVFIDDLFDQSLEAKTPRLVLTQIRRNRDVYREIFGNERLKLYESLIERAEMARRNKAGTSAAVQSTLSGVGPVDILFGAAEAVTEPVQGVRKLGAYIAKSAKTDREKNAILREALYDDELWTTLLEMPEPRAVAKWIVDWDRLVARSRAREAARTVVRTQGNNEEMSGGVQ